MALGFVPITIKSMTFNSKITWLPCAPVQFWCDFTATQYAVPGSLAADEANEIGGLKAMHSWGQRRDGAALEQRLIASAEPVRNFGLRAAVQGRYSIAVPQRFFLPAHVGLRLTAVCGARCRQEDRTRQRPAGDRRQAGAARKTTRRASSRAQVLLPGLAVRSARGGADQGSLHFRR